MTKLEALNNQLQDIHKVSKLQLKDLLINKAYDNGLTIKDFCSKYGIDEEVLNSLNDETCDITFKDSIRIIMACEKISLIQDIKEVDNCYINNFYDFMNVKEKEECFYEKMTRNECVDYIFSMNWENEIDTNEASGNELREFIRKKFGTEDELAENESIVNDICEKIKNININVTHDKGKIIYPDDHFKNNKWEYIIPDDKDKTFYININDLK